MAGTPVLSPIEQTIEKLKQYVGKPWGTVAETVDGIIEGDGFCYRWVTPAEGDVHTVGGDCRLDRINIICGPVTGNALTSALIQSFTVG